MSKALNPSWRRVATLLLGLLLAIPTVMLPAPKAFAATENAVMSDKLVDMIGVNTHFGFPDSVYYSNYNTVKQLLVDLGVRHYREGPIYGDRPETITKIKELGSLGLKSLIIPMIWESYSPYKNLPHPYVSMVKDIGIENLDGVEGANESDVWGISMAQAKIYQGNMFQDINSDPTTANLPVVLASLANSLANSQAFGDSASITDVGNVHSYPNGLKPWSPNGYYDNPVSDAFARERTYRVGSTKPIWATETGYHTDTSGLPGSGQYGISEAAQAKMISRLPFDYDEHGVGRLYLYEFIEWRTGSGWDPEAHFGIVRNNGTVKPAYTTLQRIINLMKDPGPSFTPGSLNLTFSGNTANVHHKLYQKRDGTYYLALWLDADSYNRQGRADINVAPQNVTVNLGQSFSTAKVYTPYTSAPAVSSQSNVSSLNLSVPDHIMLVELNGAGTPPLGSDLIVTDVSWSPANPVTNNEVTFSATIKNQGTSPTPTLTHGISFLVDGAQVSWSDSYVQSLAANASVTVTATWGPSGKATWTALSGTHTLTAVVDDVNRISETNETNNTLTKQLNVSTPIVYYRIKNVWKNTYLYQSDSTVLYGNPSGSDTTSQWSLESYNGKIRIKNRSTGQYMALEHQLGYVEAIPIQDSWLSAQWTLEDMNGNKRFKNAWNLSYIHVENQTGKAQYGAVYDWMLSAQWILEPV